MAQQRLPMRKIRDVLRLSAAGLSKRQIAASLGIGPTAAGACLRRAREAGVGWPLPDDLDDAALVSRLYPVPTTHGQGLAVAAGLAGDPPRVAPQGRDAATGLGGISRRASRRLRPQLVLRTLSSLGRPVVADDAAGEGGAVRRLRRHDDRHRRCQDRRGACLPAVCGRPRRIEPDLRRSNLHADVARLDRLAHTRLWLLRRCRRWSFPTI